MQQEVVNYIAAIAPEHGTLFDRVHRLILDRCPEAEVVISYKTPTYRVGKRRIKVAARSRGVSIYGWAHGDRGLTHCHPELTAAEVVCSLVGRHQCVIAEVRLVAVLAGTST